MEHFSGLTCIIGIFVLGGLIIAVQNMIQDYKDWRDNRKAK